MATRSFRPRQRRRPEAAASKAAGAAKLDALVAEAQAARGKRAHGYRERSLALHGWICARCAREFEAERLHLLTVHHKDGNHDHNPPDGSNWENLCADCHEAEHTWRTLGDYLTGRDRDR
ncbi:MAG: HNH nuclease family protein [Deltaproteobacteria bacterium]|nr:HNH nuclease family protein [Deltaproteobacteria bacterium]